MQRKDLVKTKIREKKTFFQVAHPSQCPQVDPERRDGVRIITLRHTKRNEIWLSLRDLEWAVRYLTVQHRLKGVGVVSDSDTGLGSEPQSSMDVPNEDGPTDDDECSDI